LPCLRRFNPRDDAAPDDPDATALLGVYARVRTPLRRREGRSSSLRTARATSTRRRIAVNALGYNHPVFRDAVLRALESGLVHVSTCIAPNRGTAAAELTSHAFLPRASVFCNSGRGS